MSDNIQAISQAYDGLENVLYIDDSMPWEFVSGITYKQGGLQALQDVITHGGAVPDAVLSDWLEDAQGTIDMYQEEDEIEYEEDN